MANFRHILVFLAFLNLLDKISSQERPTLYEYFSSPDGENVTGLVAERDGFKLNGLPIRIISGAMHYYRIHPDYWRDRLVETYVPWNLHEYEKDKFDFGQESNEMSIFLNVRRFVQMAKEEDLLLMFRPGPYICTEFEYGGLPSYLLRDPNMRVRTAYQPYLDRVKNYLDNLLPLVTDLQFTKGGGPIIALQLENEYASFDEVELPYLEFIRQTYWDNGIESLLFTSDGTWNGDRGSLPGVLMTANFGGDPQSSLNELLEMQPDKPCMVMEFWCGWFDHWFEKHHIVTAQEVGEVLEVILGPYNGSVNFYMFHGGTNFGFNAGANIAGTKQNPEYQPDITSYDYDGPLSEAGDYTLKYYEIVKHITKYQLPALKRPALPQETPKMALPNLGIDKFLTFADILDQVPDSAKYTFPERISMENFPINGESGQKQGYVLYRKRANFGNGTLFYLCEDSPTQQYPYEGG